MLGFDKKLTGLFGKITKFYGARYFVHKLSACFLAFLHNFVSAYIFFKLVKFCTRKGKFG